LASSLAGLRQRSGVIQARRLESQDHSASPVWSTARPSLTDYERRMEEAYGDDEVGADEELGILYAGTPDSYDDLKRINGISADSEARLNASGVSSIEADLGLV